MRIEKPKKFDRLAYRCKCATCGTKVEVEKKDLHYAGKFDLYWICPICCLEQRVSAFKLIKSEVAYYIECEGE